MEPLSQLARPRSHSVSPEATPRSVWSRGTPSRPPPGEMQAELDEVALMVAPDDDPPTPEVPPPLQLMPPPKAPDLPEPPSPPEVKVESETVAGWPKWLVEELETRVSAAAEEKRLDEEAPGPIDRSMSSADADVSNGDFVEPDGDPIATCAAAKMARFPLLCLFSILAIVLLPIAVGIWGIPFLDVKGLPLTIEATFDSFLQTDVPAAVALRSFELAMAERPASTRRLQGVAGGQPYSAVKDLILFYEMEDDHGLPGGLLARHAVTAISAFERRLRALPRWRSLCGRAEAGASELCEPGASLAGYARATWERNGSETLEPLALRFDGGGSDPLNLPTALHFLERHRLSPLVLPSGTNATPEVPDVRVLRSAFRFKIYCCDQDSSSVALRRDFNQRTDEEWEDFVRGDLLPLLEQGPGRGVRVSFDGSQMETIEVHMALWNDVRFALGSLIFVHVYLMCHTRSILLSLLGPLIAALALPLSFTVCGFVFGATSVSFASALALFLTVGFGADVILVYTDFWRSSASRKSSDAERLAWTFRHAGGASFATTATTALSFFANLASAIRALRQFAFLMGLCVVFAWILISLIYTPLCIVNERIIRCLCPRKVRRTLATEAGTNSRLLATKVTTLRAFRYFVLLLSFAVSGLFVGLSVPQVEMGTALPQIFPDDHNRERVKGLVLKFEPLANAFGKDFQAPQLQEPICSKEKAARNDPACALHWCVAEPSPAAEGQGGGCSCWRGRLSPGTCTSFPAWVKGVTRVVGVGELTTEQLTQVADSRVAAQSSQPSSGSRLISSSSSGLSPLLLQDWLSGSVQLVPFSEATGLYHFAARGLGDSGGTAASPAAAPAWSQNCDWQDLCFCGNASYVCELPAGSWTRLSDFDLPGTAASGQASPASRSLAMVSAPGPYNQLELAKVRVGFGIWVRDSSALLGNQDAAESWGYVDGFVARDPWVQRTMLKFCDELPVALAVVEKWCWIEDFRDWLQSRGNRFPTREQEFDSLGLAFADTVGYGTSGREYLWVEENSLKAFYFTFLMNVPKDARASVSLDYKGYWDAYVDHFKALAAAEGRGKLGIIHTAALWRDAEAESELLRSTVVTIAIVLGLAFLGMLAFTRSMILSAYVVASTLQAMVGLVFFITVVMQWKLGLIEVIAIIYFVGYAVTYPLHVAHKYADPEALRVRPNLNLSSENDRRRYQRTKWALKSIGGAALGSAMTTAGASLFLVFCTLTVFGKLGSMCLAVTVMSILTALGPLPAALLTFGPPKPGLCSGA